MPRVIHITVARFRADLPKPGEPLDFLVTIHEEGTGISWQQNIRVEPETERYFLKLTRELYFWSKEQGLPPEKANQHVRELGMRLYATFIGSQGAKILGNIKPTAVLFNIDETILNLPWELIGAQDQMLSQQVPFGRLVTTRTIPRQGKDPLQEDTNVNILAIANPTIDLAATEPEISSIKNLEGNHGSFSVKVDVLSKDDATRDRFTAMLAAGDYDIIHFAGHASFNPFEPESSALHFADGLISADDALNLPWKAPPYFVFNSACETGRAAGGERLVSEENHTNGLAAAFLSAGVYGYAGYFWPVTDTGASLFAKTFYGSLLSVQNVGLALLHARKKTISQLGQKGDLTGYSCVLFGDAASKHRRDLFEAV